jgi:hypothetical protein
MSQESLHRAYRQGLAKDFRASIEKQFGPKPENLAAFLAREAARQAQDHRQTPGQEVER